MQTSGLKPGFPCCRKINVLSRALVFLILIANFGHAQEKAPKPQKQFRFEGTAIEGEREKPKDLYILTWKESRPLEPTPMDLEFLKTYQNAGDIYQFEQEMNYKNLMK